MAIEPSRSGRGYTGAMSPLPDRLDLVRFGQLVSDPSRAAMLLSLMDGLSRPATELAALARVTPQTASAHLKRLLAGGLLAVEARGRHRYFRLAGEAVADALEAVALQGRPRPRGVPTALEAARTCYQHLAGRLGVALLLSLEREGRLRLDGGELRPTKAGLEALARAGLAEALPAGKPCLDWTERRNHLGGPLGVRITRHLFSQRWITRLGDGRAVRVTTAGRRELPRRLGLPPSALE